MPSTVNCGRQMRRAVRLIAVITLTLIMGGAAAPQTATVDLQLVLAVDASGSVNQERFELQKQGYAAAFRNPRVLRAIRSGRNQGIVVTMLQWTGPTQQIIVVPWLPARDQASAETLADAIDKSQRQLYGGGTSISGAIDFSVLLM